MKKGFLLFISFTLLLSISSCKPSEKNYQAAYDAAKNKREAAKASDAELSIPAKGFHEFGETPQTVIDGKTVKTTTEFLSLVKGEKESLKKWNVAVGCFKMKTNAVSQMAGLEKKGLKPYVAECAEDKFYVFAAGFDSAKEAAEFATKYAADKDSASFVGLDGGPLLVEKRW